MKRSPCIATGRRRGFTLIELLIVILIIAMLIAILIPAIMSALNLAKLLACKSNLSQIALAANDYTANYKGAILPTAIKKSDGTLLYWCNILAQRGLACENSVSLAAGVKTQRDSPFICPITNDAQVRESDFTAQSTPQDTTGKGWFRLGNATIATDCTYYWNGYIGTNATQKTYYPSLLFDESVTDPTLRATMLHDISEIRQRSTMAMVMDGDFFQSADTPDLSRIAMRHSGGTYGANSITVIAYYDGHVDALDRYVAQPAPTAWLTAGEDDPDVPSPPQIPISSKLRTTAIPQGTSVSPLDWGPPWFLLRQPR